MEKAVSIRSRYTGSRSDTPPTPDAYEVGQLYPFGRVINFKGNQYIFYFYRDDTHYEHPANEMVERSIYMLPLRQRADSR